MIQVGIFTGYFPYTLEETAMKIRAHGFNTVQLDLLFSDVDMSTDAITANTCRKIRDTFRRHDLPVSCISSYTNLTAPDPGRREEELARLRTIIRHAHDLGSPYVPSETGTFDPDSDWVDHPKNRTEEGYEECRDIIAGLVKEAREHGAVFVIEPYVNNVIGTVERTLRLFAEIDDPCLGLAMDPNNFFDEHLIRDMDGTLNYMFDALSDKIVFAHAKDVKLLEADEGVRFSGVKATEGHALKGVGRIELPAPGSGSLNYTLFLTRLAKASPNCPLIIEHLEEDDVARAKRFVDDQLVEAGV